ncbi:MAG: hypothetical protein WBK28_01780 [Minisyncoccia bacterium]
MDEITIDGKTYISSKRAASITGYAKDYVGQLCREGRIEARLIGRSWYVYEPSLEAHRFEDGRKAEKGNTGTAKESMPASISEEANSHSGNRSPSDISNIQAVWQPPVYTSETQTEVPELKKTTPETEQIGRNEEHRLSEMQAAWHEWFSRVVSPPMVKNQDEEENVPINVLDEEENEREEEIPQIERYVVEEPAPVPVRKILSEVTLPREENERTEVQPQRQEIRREEGEKRQRSSRKTSRKAQKGLGRAIFVALTLLIISLSLIATGFIDSLHLGSFTESSVFKYIGGNTELK